jgi:uncharacterized membrane protein (UPF0127 family)
MCTSQSSKTFDLISLQQITSEDIDEVKLWVADHWKTRLWGLIGLQTLAPHQGLWIPACRAVHTLGMRFDLALHFLDADYNLVRSYGRVPPSRMVFCRSATSVVEMLAVHTDESLHCQAIAVQRALIKREQSGTGCSSPGSGESQG